MLHSFDNKNEIWFCGKEIPLILDDKKLINFKLQQISTGTKTVPQAESHEITRKCYFINESGFYSLILSSKQPKAREFKHLVTSKVLPSIRKKGYYDIKSNKLVIESEFDLHCKVVDFIRSKYPQALMVAGLGENQTTPAIRMSRWKKGYMSGQCDLMIINPTSKYNSLCLEFKSPIGSYRVSEKQLQMKEMYVKNKCKYLMSNSFDDVIFEVIKHLEESEKYLKRRSK